MRFVTTRGEAPPTSLEWALFDGLAPDGSLYVPESIDRWTPAGACRAAVTLAGRDRRSRASALHVRRDRRGDARVDRRRCAELSRFRSKEIEPGVHALELFHGPTLAFKDIGARVMARLISALHDRSAPTSVLVATSGDTGSAVAHAFYRVPHTRVLVLYPDGRVSPQQQAQMAMFNAEPDTNVRAYAVAGNFDDCQRLVKAASADPDVLGARPGDVGQFDQHRPAAAADGLLLSRHRAARVSDGPACRRRRRRVDAQRQFRQPDGRPDGQACRACRSRVSWPPPTSTMSCPIYLATGRFEPRPSQQTLANAMDVGHPSNFDRMLWMYHGGLDAMRADIVGSRHSDDEVKATIRRVYDTRGYLLDPHSAIGYLGLTTTGVDLQKTPGIFLATAHPAKFHEVVESIIGQTDREAGGAGRRARASPAHHPHRGVARRGQGTPV